MSSSAPVFILSTERSGSTLLRFILDTHPDLCCPGELYLGRLIKDLRLTLSRTLGLAAGERAEDRDRAEQGEVRRILEEVMGKYARARGKRIWCEKTPYNLLALADIEWVFPDARYICLHRNSWDVVQSCLDLPEKNLLWWALSYVVKHQRDYPAAYLDNWIEKTEEILRLEARHPRAFRLHYESLVADPVKTLGPLFEFLELDWEVSLVDRVFKVSHDLGGGDVRIESTDRIEKDRTGKGASLDQSLAARLPAGLLQRQRELHRQLGYP